MRQYSAQVYRTQFVGATPLALEVNERRPSQAPRPSSFDECIANATGRSKASIPTSIWNVSLLVAIAVNGEGYREILGICEGAKEDKAGWSAFLKHLTHLRQCDLLSN